MRLILSLAVLGALFFAFSWYVLSRSLPEYTKTVQLEQLIAPVEIVRDTANVPHIFGKNDHDTLFALGYAHAQDRLWQMTMLRRTAQGRLSELFGEATLPIDMTVRRLAIYSAARQSLSALRPDTLAKLDAYALGVNARLREINESALGRGAPEFFIFSNAISPWTAADSLAIVKLMGIQLSSHLHQEVLRARASLVLEGDRIKDLLPDMPGNSQADLIDFTRLFPDSRPLKPHLHESTQLSRRSNP